MTNFLNWINGNKEWLFSGIGVILIVWIIKRIIGIFFSKDKSKGNDDKTFIPPSEIGFTARSSFFCWFFSKKASI